MDFGTADPYNARDHRAAGVIAASKHAQSAASRASHCYSAYSQSGRRDVSLGGNLTFEQEVQTALPGHYGSQTGLAVHAIEPPTIFAEIIKRFKNLFFIVAPDLNCEVVNLVFVPPIFHLSIL
jgi:hypothetical protein